MSKTVFVKAHYRSRPKPKFIVPPVTESDDRDSFASIRTGAGVEFVAIALGFCFLCIFWIF